MQSGLAREGGAGAGEEKARDEAEELAAARKCHIKEYGLGPATQDLCVLE